MSLDVEKYKKIAAEATKKAYELCQETEGWNQVSTNVGDEATLEWREGDVGGVVRDDGEEGGAAGWRCWRVTATMEAEMDTVINVLMDYNNCCTWNPALTKAQILEKTDDEFMITYQVTAGQRPIVSLRDFTMLVSVIRDTNLWVGGGCSVSLPSHPPNNQYVRAWQYPTCMEVIPCSSDSGLTKFTWLLQCDFGGMMPPSLLNLAMPYCIKLFTSSLRKQVKKIQKQKQN